MKPEKLTLKHVEKALGERAPEWEGCCYKIACAIVKYRLVEGTAVYGHWRGPVAPGSMFDRGATFSRHGWVALADGRVLDPTRWVFEGKEPYLYLGPADHYDEGGNRLRRETRSPPPDFDPDERTFDITGDVLAPAPWTFVEQQLQLMESDYYERAKPGVLSLSQLHWLATAPLDELGEHAAAIYAALDKLGKRGLVPIDNWRRVKEGRWP